MRSRAQRNVAANTGAPVATPTGPVFAAPTLNLTASATARNVVAQWSSAYPDVQLQSVNSLDGPGPYNFINVATTPVLIDGKYTQSNAVAAPRQFFRLAK